MSFIQKLKKNSIKPLLSFFVASVVFSSAAFAQSVTGAAVSAIPPPTPPAIGFIGGYAYGPTIDMSLNPILNSMNLTLNTKLADLGNYLHGNENMGNGLIELLMSMDSKMSKSNAMQSESGSTNDMAARVRAYQEMKIKDALNKNYAYNPNTQKAVVNPQKMLEACQDETMAGGRAGAVAGASQVRSVMTQVLANNVSDNKTGVERLGAIIGQHANYCSPQDIQNNRPGCSGSQAHPSTMPNADQDISSVYQGATQPGQPTNSSLDANQQKAALAYVNSILPQIPSDPPASQINTPPGRVYAANLQRFRSRVSAVYTGFASDIAMRSAASDTPNAVRGLPNSQVNVNNITTSGFGANHQQDWNSQAVKSKWQYLFGSNVSFPSKPSEWDVLKFDVFSRYADANPNDPNAWQNRVGNFDQTESLQELNRQMAVQNRLLFYLANQLNENNRIQRLQLTQKLDPITSQELESERSNIQ